MLRYATKLTESPNLIGENDIAALEESGWGDVAIWEITALASLFNFTGRLEAASGLPPDQVPNEANFAEAREG